MGNIVGLYWGYIGTMENKKGNHITFLFGNREMGPTSFARS